MQGLRSRTGVPSTSIEALDVDAESPVPRARRQTEEPEAVRAVLGALGEDADLRPRRVPPRTHARRCAHPPDRRGRSGRGPPRGRRRRGRAAQSGVKRRGSRRMVARTAAQSSSRTSGRPPATRPIGRMPSGGSGGGAAAHDAARARAGLGLPRPASSIARRPSSRRITTEAHRPVAVVPVAGGPARRGSAARRRRASPARLPTRTAPPA